jgi:hypothetical protein
MRELGRRDGAVRLDDKTTVSDGAPPVTIAESAGKVRIGLANQTLFGRVAPLERYIKQAPAAIKKLRTGGILLGENLKRLEVELQTLREKLPSAEKARDEIRDKLEALPFFRRGVIRDRRLVWFVLAAVGSFDGAVLHSALTQTSLDPISIWFTTASVAILLAAINEPFGRLAAAIALAAPGRWRMKLASFAMVVGVLALGSAITLLGIFRHLAAVQQNQSLTALARGQSNVSLSFIIDPSFLAPLQLAGCAAAMIAVALYVLGSESRDLRAALHDADADVDGLVGGIATIERDIEKTREQITAALLGAYDIEANADGARADVINATKEFEALVSTETAQSLEMASIYRSERNFVQRMFANGGVWWTQLPTVHPRWGRPYTPGPLVDANDEDVIEERQRQSDRTERNQYRRPSPNGKHDEPIDPNRFRKQ